MAILPMGYDLGIGFLLAPVFLLLIFSIPGAVHCQALGNLEDVSKGAAEAVVNALHAAGHTDMRLEKMNEATLQVFCGHEFQVGVNLDGREYQLSTGNEVEWAKFGTSMLKVGSGSLANNVDCQLPDVNLMGPLEIHLKSELDASILLPQGPSFLHSISKLIIKEGASVRLSGVQGLELMHPLTLPMLPSSYLESIFGKPSSGSTRSRQTEEASTNGLLHLSSKLHQMALKQPKKSPLLGFHLHVSEQGLALSGVDTGSLSQMEVAPGVIEISETAQGWESSSVDEPWTWPFVNLKGASLDNYESLFKSFLSAHWPPLESRIQVTSASSEALHLLHFEMDIRRDSQAGYSPLPEFETPDGALEVWQAAVMVKRSKSKNIFIPIQLDRLEHHDNTITMSPMAKSMLAANATFSEENHLTDIYF